MSEPTMEVDAVASTDYVIAKRKSGNRVFEFTAALSNFALTTLNQTVTAVKTFSSTPIFSAGSALGAAAGAAGSQYNTVIRKTGIADNTATDVITVTVPNAEHNAGIFLDIVAHLGAGTDNSESTRVATGVIAVARKTGDATVGVASTLAQTAIATTSGGGTITLAYAVSTITGAASVTQTFTITLTIVKTGTVTDHTAVIGVRVLNSAASGITVAAS